MGKIGKVTLVIVVFIVGFSIGIVGFNFMVNSNDDTASQQANGQDIKDIDERKNKNVSNVSSDIESKQENVSSMSSDTESKQENISSISSDTKSKQENISSMSSDTESKQDNISSMSTDTESKKEKVIIHKAVQTESNIESDINVSSTLTDMENEYENEKIIIYQEFQTESSVQSDFENANNQGDDSPAIKYLGEWAGYRPSLVILPSNNENSYDIEVRWANSAFETCLFKITAYYNPDNDRLEYTNGYEYIYNSTEGNRLERTDLCGYFEYHSDLEMIWVDPEVRENGEPFKKKIY